MADLVVLCPTRNRPKAANEAMDAFEQTKTGTTSLLFVIDDDDLSLPEYEFGLPTLIVPRDEGGDMVKALNHAARLITKDWPPTYLGFVGDDHRFRTNGWDTALIEALDSSGGGFAYGNDLFWPNGEIPTQIFMSSSIVQALGWMGLPTCKHLYIDNAWRILGEATSLIYLSDVIIEHLHPATGKVKADEGHVRVNAPAMYEHDRHAFEEWQASQMEADIEIARAAL